MGVSGFICLRQYFGGMIYSGDVCQQQPSPDLLVFWCSRMHSSIEVVLQNFLRLGRARFVLLGCQWSPWKPFFFLQELLLLKIIYRKK